MTALRLSHLDRKYFTCLSIYTNTSKIIMILTMHDLKNNLWLWLGQNPVVVVFNFNFLLLFNYSCVPFLPIPPPHPSKTQFLKIFSLFPQMSKNGLTLKYQMPLSNYSKSIYILKFKGKINPWLSNIHIYYALKYILYTYTHKYTCITYIYNHVIVICLTIQKSLPHYILFFLKHICILTWSLT